MTATGAMVTMTGTDGTRTAITIAPAGATIAITGAIETDFTGTIATIGARVKPYLFFQLPILHIIVLALIGSYNPQ
jgi:hypothetical protein